MICLKGIHSDLCEKARTLMLAKNHDYSFGDDPFHNFRGAEKLGLHPVQGVLLRMQDKLQRIGTFVATEGKLMVTGEAVEDSVLDIINYAIIIAALVEEERIRKQQNKDS